MVLLSNFSTGNRPITIPLPAPEHPGFLPQQALTDYFSWQGESGGFHTVKLSFPPTLCPTAQKTDLR